MKISILGVEISQIDLPGTIGIISKWLGQEDQHLLATVNPEFVVAAQKDREFKDILNGNEINTCDGSGLVWASEFLYRKKLTKVTGVDLAEKLLTSKEDEIKIFLLGGEGTAEKVREKFPERTVDFSSGGKLDADLRFSDQEKILEQIRESRANILFVALPQVKQVKWIKRNLSSIPSVKAAIVLGGTFDYLSGRIKRAPKIMRTMGLEWLFRLVSQPSRIGRIYNATVKFTFLILKEKWKNK
ncbi:MAG: WecB/TagA/CpsF family glycosyltransferase [Patescibacteria group bacterium]